MPWAGQTQSNWAGQAHQPPPASEETESDERGDPDQKRRRVMIGGAATVGIVSLISIGFSAMGEDVVVARCIDDRNVVIDEANCPDPGRASSTAGSGGYGPSPLLGGARQYHYTYGGSGNYGEIAAGGSNVMPRKVTIVTLSGRTLVQRGGFGQTSHRSSGS